ncbi:MAG TPA: diguanylate cyclase [Anaerolineaceae bacterium]|nr:diguanylate cyclase [Anaerolineaceae bacterium]HPN54151.1 diguanylate cyclase [Anaerolineaceae bacterium]
MSASLPGEDYIDGVAVIDHQNKILYVSGSIIRSWGYHSEEVIGQPFTHFLDEDGQKTVARKIFEYEKNGYSPDFFETGMITHDGTRLPVEANLAFFPLPPNRITVVQLRDMTYRRSSNEMARTQTAIYQISEAVFSTHNLYDLYAKIHQIVGELLPARNFFIGLYNMENQTVRFPYYVDEFDPAPPSTYDTPEPLENGATPYVIRKGQTILLTRQHYLDLIASGEIELVGTLPEEWLGAPLRDEKGKIIGVLAVQIYDDSGHYTPHDMELLTFVSVQVGMAIARKEAEVALRESEERFRLVVQNSHDGIIIINDQFIVTYVNPEMARIMDQTAESLLNQDFRDYLDEPSKKIAVDHYLRRQKHEPVTPRYELNIVTHSGLLRPVEVSSAVIVDVTGQSWTVTQCLDISDRKKADLALQDAMQQLTLRIEELEIRNRESRMLNEMGDMLQSCRSIQDIYDLVAKYGPSLFPNQDGNLYIYNPLSRLYESVVAWGDGKRSSERTFTMNDCWGLRRGHLHLVAKDGAVSCPHAHAHPSLCLPMKVQSENIGLFHISGEINDPFAFRQTGDLSLKSRWIQLAQTVSERLALAVTNTQLRENLRQQSIRDPLTNLFNRRYMEETLDRELARALRYQRPLSLIMVDIDRFKTFNDTYGHEVGDVVLSKLGEYLLHNMRSEDIACRYGGEEFLLILPESPLADTLRRAEQLRQGISSIALSHLGQPIPSVTASFGVAAFPEHGVNTAVLRKAADMALYAAKDQGRNCVVIARLQ